MSLSAKEWYNLGFETGKIDKGLTRLAFTMRNKYGKNNVYTKLCFKLLNNSFAGLRSNLDDIICKEFPLCDNMLPGHNLALTEVFYCINRYTIEETDSFIYRIRPLPKMLSRTDIDDINKTIMFTKRFLVKVNHLFFFSGKNIYVNTIHKLLIKLELFLAPIIESYRDEDILASLPRKAFY